MKPRRESVPRLVHGRAAFGRTELIAVLALAGLTVALALPALQASRERARLATCGDRLRQIGLALAAYHDAQGWLPPAAYWRGDGRPVDRLDDESWTGDITYQNWLQLLLPYAGAQELAEMFDCEAPITDERNERGRTSELALVTCPSDRFHRADNRHEYRAPAGGGEPGARPAGSLRTSATGAGTLTSSATPASSASGAQFARGNYAINGGSHTLGRWPGNAAMPVAEGWHYEVDAATGTFAWYGTGVAGINKAFRLDELRNGLAATVVVDEIRSGFHPLDPRGSWAFGQIAASITWGHGVTGDDGGPNNMRARADDILNCGAMLELLGPHAALEAGMPCVWYWNKNAQATARSMHPGGVQLLTADGAMHFASDGIDRGVWHAIHSREFPSEALRDVDFSDGTAKREEARPMERAAGGLTTSATDAAISTAEELPERIENSIGMRLVLIRAGAFMMGVPDLGWRDTDSNESAPKDCPPHGVRLSWPFHIGAYEVTQAEYERVMGENPSWHVTCRGFESDRSFATDRMPVEQVSWHAAAEFCRRLSELPDEQAAGLRYRLPTEAEWEYVCRGGRSEPYAWTKEPNRTSGETAGPARAYALPLMSIGSFPPNALGVYDMRGNVYEWCQDWFRRDYYQHSPCNDPQGPAAGYFRMVRGGDWIFTGEGCPINRTVTPPWASDRFLGFRVVAEPPADGRLPDRPSGAWPVGTELAVACEHRNPRNTELVLLDPADRHARLLYDEPATAPTWHPSGARLAFANGKNLFVLDLESQQATNLTEGRLGEVFDAAWSPDGETIAFSSPSSRGYCTIFGIDAQGGEPRELGSLAGRFPAWSPDGKRIMFVRDEAGGAQGFRLVEIGLDGGNLRQVLAESVPWNAAPAWAPDGRRFVFSHWGKTPRHRQLCLAAADGQIVERLTSEEGFATFAAWSPDGRYVSYAEFGVEPTRPGDRGDLLIYDVEQLRSRVVSRGTLPQHEHARAAWRPQP
ncbi:MAG TPA: SUMF1/EgtB/PvdO family nonheme iron enzyme [Pirellulales bacterium]|nr:SUMF1/EgtB/PvdO family nonheme iron enzyme [Pirellulales bacterium]